MLENGKENIRSNERNMTSISCSQIEVIVIDVVNKGRERAVEYLDPLA